MGKTWGMTKVGGPDNISLEHPVDSRLESRFGIWERMSKEILQGIAMNGHCSCLVFRGVMSLKLRVLN